MSKELLVASCMKLLLRLPPSDTTLLFVVMMLWAIIDCFSMLEVVHLSSFLSPRFIITWINLNSSCNTVAGWWQLVHSSHSNWLSQNTLKISDSNCQKTSLKKYHGRGWLVRKDYFFLLKTPRFCRLGPLYSSKTFKNITFQNPFAIPRVETTIKTFFFSSISKNYITMSSEIYLQCYFFFFFAESNFQNPPIYFFF